MGLTSSADSLGPQDRATLLAIAKASIATGVATGESLTVDAERHSQALQVQAGCFVTLRIEGVLRGCVGSLRARGPLASEVARSAFMAAFRDPRFPALTAAEADGLEIHISVLSRPTPFEVESEEELFATLRAGIDGLILREGGLMGTFLPDVWESIPGPREFVQQLKLKAGMAADHWSDDIELERYTTESFE